MPRRLTDDDLKIRHSALHAWLAVLGFVPDDASKDTCWRIQERALAAIERGDVIRDDTGHYRLSRERYDLQVARNVAQPRRRRRAA
jgi:hypothetical protein